MNYQLCKKLKDAGFPQRGDGKDLGINKKDTPLLSQILENVYFPTLSELIKECGDEYLMLTKAKYGWIADSIDPTDRTTGKTPKEAVAKLWLKLKNKK
jgi:hypothetical protein